MGQNQVPIYLFTHLTQLISEQPAQLHGYVRHPFNLEFFGSSKIKMKKSSFTSLSNKQVKRVKWVEIKRVKQVNLLTNLIKRVK